MMDSFIHSLTLEQASQDDSVTTLPKAECTQTRYKSRVDQIAAGDGEDDDDEDDEDDDDDDDDDEDEDDEDGQNACAATTVAIGATGLLLDTRTEACFCATAAVSKLDNRPSPPLASRLAASSLYPCISALNFSMSPALLRAGITMGDWNSIGGLYVMPQSALHLAKSETPPSERRVCISASSLSA